MIWGVPRVKATWAWNQGYTGQGVVLAGQDTGYQWTHPALKNAYRGYDPATGLADHDYSWHDSIHANAGSNPCGHDSPVPCDDNSHGTHTMGTMAGNDAPDGSPGWPATALNPIGVAPGARWIGCRNMDAGRGTPATYIECFEWLLAPYPVGGSTDQGDPARAPDIINNSWHCPTSEGCTGAEIQPALDAADAAGILVVASAGNSGPACASIIDPPAIYPRSVSVGATGSTDALASFSSRGPLTYDGQTYTGPDLSGPGVSIYSSVRGGYGTLSGTSMAAPHVSGVAALLLSAAPALRGRPDMTRAILARTAEPFAYAACGAEPGGLPNNGYGWGIVDAQAAIESLGQPGTLSGSVTAAGGGEPVPAATVMLYDAAGATVLETVTDDAGRYRFVRAWGAYQVKAAAVGFDPQAAGPTYLVGGRTTEQDLALATVPGVTDLSIAATAGDALLQWTWPAGNAAGFELWRGLAPYFSTDDPDAALVAVIGAAPSACSTEGDRVACRDAGMLGDPTTQHYYLVLTTGAGGGTAQPAGRVGEFDFSLTISP